MRKWIFLTALVVPFQIMAQWSCPSKINAHLKPFWEDGPVSWAMEGEAGGGLLGDRQLLNGMGLGALELYLNHISIYAEGGVKYWNTNENGVYFENTRLGMRELYLNPSLGNHSVKVGLQSLQLQDMFVFNERTMAASYRYKNNGFLLEAAAGTVSEQFARNGSFCTKCFQYDIIMNRTRPYLASQPFEEKFSAVTVSFKPAQYKKKAERKSENRESNDEFGSFEEVGKDEFSNTDEFSTDELSGGGDEFGSFNARPTKKFPLKLESAGVIIYSEFGQYNAGTGFWSGAFGSLTLPLNLTFKTEALFQYLGSNQGTFLINSLEGNYSSKLGFTDFYAVYYHFFKGTQNATPALSYTNLFLGEVLRLESVEMPLLSVYAKHRFKGKGLSIKVQYATNTVAERLYEEDIQITKTLGKHFHLSCTAGYITQRLPQNRTWLGRAELRFTF
ncbi:hypothetical protein [Saccharicrinis sp. FJH54]|uniref:hypothetical protein n=1 Tax=Saccharicrinis sp. FJH54 TaxID=3344665 RepID=UPI0035D4F349